MHALKKGSKTRRNQQLYPLMFYLYLHVLIDAELNLNSETHKGKQTVTLT